MNGERPSAVVRRRRTGLALIVGSSYHILHGPGRLRSHRSLKLEVVGGQPFLTLATN
jgi:hypothetical protein